MDDKKTTTGPENPPGKEPVEVITETSQAGPANKAKPAKQKSGKSKSGGGRSPGMIVALGLLSAAGAGLGYAIAKQRRAKQKPKEPVEEEAPPPKPDEPPGVVICAQCGNKFKEFELYCPYCRGPAEDAAAAH